MPISGDLREFDLSYIFGLISQEKKTGRLKLTDDKKEAYILFKEGMIIAAGNRKRNLRTILHNYTALIKNVDVLKIQKVALKNRNNFNGFINGLINNNYIGQEEAAELITGILEDLSCELFTWHTGSYYFDTDPNIRSYYVSGVSVSPDAVTMEAARRMDELKMMKDVIKLSTVFIIAQQEQYQAGNLSGPEKSLREDILSKIDGASSVEYILKNSFLPEFKVYDILNNLLSEGVISPLPDKFSKSINAALQRKLSIKESFGRGVVLSSIVTAVTASILFFFGITLYRGRIIKPYIEEKKAYLESIDNRKRASNITISTIFYRTKHGIFPGNHTILIKEGLLSKRVLY